MQKVCLYLEKLASVQHRPDAPQTELTDVVVTDISLFRLPPVRPYEYLLNAGESAVMWPPQSTVFCILYMGNAGSVSKCSIDNSLHSVGFGSKLMNKTL